MTYYQPNNINNRLSYQVQQARYQYLWNYATKKPETSSAEELPTNLLAPPTSESLKNPTNYQPDMQETDVDTATRVFRFRHKIRKPLYYLSRYTRDVAFITFIQKFLPQHTHEELLSLLQLDTKGQSELHPIALMSDHIFSFIGSYAYTMHLKYYLS